MYDSVVSNVIVISETQKCTVQPPSVCMFCCFALSFSILHSFQFVVRNMRRPGRRRSLKGGGILLVHYTLRQFKHRQHQRACFSQLLLVLLKIK